MGHHYIVLGAGRQGAAIAYDFVRHGEAESVVLADQDEARARKVAAQIERLTGKNLISVRSGDASGLETIRSLLKGGEVVVSALPYFLNEAAAEAAVAEGLHFTDLGGNTDVVRKELELDAEARHAGISLLPDCGLAPGFSNLLAAWAIQQFDRTETIRARCGGLPQNPRPPFGYKMTFSPHGLINEYSGEAVCLREGEIARVPTLTEREEIEVPGLGTLEAAVTSGGTSTAPESFSGRVRDFDYKTLRYPGHFAAMKGFSDLGLFSLDPIEVEGARIVPRKLFIELLTPLIDFPQDRDLVVLWVEATGTQQGRRRTLRMLMIDRGDPDGHFTAMERTTGFPTSTIAYLQACGKIPPGASPIEKAVPLPELLAGIRRRGLVLEETWHDS